MGLVELKERFACDLEDGIALRESAFAHGSQQTCEVGIGVVRAQARQIVFEGGLRGAILFITCHWNGGFSKSFFHSF